MSCGGGVYPCVSTGYKYFEVYKGINGFDERYCPNPFYGASMIRILNNTPSRLTLEHKNLLSYIFKGLNQPATVIKRFGGGFFDGNDNPISFNDAVEIIHCCDVRMILKQATESTWGNNIEIIEPGVPKAEIINRLKSRTIDYIVQKCVKQSPLTAAFNPTSLNTIRITSIRDNAGDIHIYTRCIKAGGKGKFVDNIGGGKGGVIIGINPDGTLKPNGYTSELDMLTEYNGVVFNKFSIPQIDRIDTFARECHARIPDCKVVGWDIALDDTDAPLLIEANLTYPGIILEQLCSGPVFGDITGEIIDYVRNPYKAR